MTKKISYNPLAFILLWLCCFFVNIIYSQDCGCINCPLPILDQNISTAIYVIDGAQNNSLTTNQIEVVELSFNHSYPAELEMLLISPAGQAVTLIGPSTSASAVFFGGFDVSFVSNIAMTDPDPGMSTIWDNEDLTGLNQYVGAYLPYSGSLQNFNTGTVNGQWQLEIVDPNQFDTGTLEDFSIIFVDQEGIECCEADGGTMDMDPLIACEGADTLMLTIEPTYLDAAPSEAVYGYTYLVTENDIILDINENPNLTTYPPGTYEVYGFSYDLLDEDQIPSPSNGLSLSNFNSNLIGTNPIICGDISDTFYPVIILNGSSETMLSDTICNGAVYPFGDESLTVSGTYRDTFATSPTCDSIVILDLLVATADTISVLMLTCDPAEVGADTIFTSNIFDCDSLVITQFRLSLSDTTYIDEQTCTASENNSMDTLVLTTPTCDSIIITTYIYEVPDTIFAIERTCLIEEIGIDTVPILLDPICPDILIRETILYLIDTTYLSDFTCDEASAGESAVFIPTDSCARVEITLTTFIGPDTTYLDAEDCIFSNAGIDTLFLTNQSLCDSLIITTTIFLSSDTIEQVQFSCDMEDVGIDTLILTNQNTCDSLVITTTNFSAADTTYLSELTCDALQVDPNVQTFSTSSCDSIVITEYIYSAPDTTYQTQITCEADQAPDTILLQNNLGCDSLVITIYNSKIFPPTLLTDMTCDLSQEPTQTDTIAGAFCDSIIITTFNFIKSDTTIIEEVVCDLGEFGADTLYLTNVAGCDSLVITYNISQPIEATSLESFTCDIERIGLDSMIFKSSEGCDSLVVTDYILADADTVYLSEVFTCNEDQVGADTTIFNTNTCDSVVISTISFLPIDTVFIESFLCDLTTAISDTIIYQTSEACDSIVVTITFPLLATESTINEPTMNPSLVGLDTTILVNAVGCDSLVITNTILVNNATDTVFINLPTCNTTISIDTVVGVEGVINIITPVYFTIDTTYLEVDTCASNILPNDTISLVNPLGCDSIVVTQYIPIELDTTYLMDTTCDPDFELEETIYLTSIDGCDSVVVINYEFNTTDTIYRTIEACQFQPSDTTTVSGADCPTIRITNYENLSTDTVFISEVSCIGLVGIDTITVINSSGCDSTTVIELIAAEPSETILEQISCQENLANDTLFLSGISCDSLIITTYSYEPIQDIEIDIFTCDPSQVFQDTVILTTVDQCDSTIIYNTILVDSDTIRLETFTCDPTEVGLDSMIIDGGLCEILQITESILQPIDIIRTVVPTCDPTDTKPDTIFLTNIFGCDSLVIQDKNFQTITLTDVEEITCDPSSVGISVDTLSSILGCDSIIIYTTTLGAQEELFIELLTCDASVVGIDTTLIDGPDCPMLLITETILSAILDTTYLVEKTCDEGLIQEPIMNTFTNAAGCDSVVVFTYMLDAFNPSPETDIFSPICAGEASGRVFMQVDPSIEVRWLIDDFVGNQREDLLAGSYQVRLSKADCSTSIEVVVPPTQDILLNLVQDYTICSNSGGTIFVQASGGTEPYEYAWDDTSQDSTRFNLADGIYTLTLTDANACSTISSSQVANVPGLTYEITIESVSCFGEADGSIHIDLLTGTPPYDVRWQDGDTNLYREGLVAGTYSCTIVDANDCNLTLNRLVFEPNILAVVFDIPNTGELEAQVTGGTPPYDYLWNDGTTVPTVEEPISGFTYEVLVTDTNGCQAFRTEVFATNHTKSFKDASISIFPNPNDGDFHISFGDHLRLQQLYVHSIFGQQVAHLHYQDLINGTDISLPEVSSGTYILEAHFDQGVFMQKMIVF